MRFLLKMFVRLILVFIALYFLGAVISTYFYSGFTEIPNKIGSGGQGKIYTYSGRTLNDTARVVVLDHKFGGGGVYKAIAHGDEFFDELRMVSQRYQLINNRNVIWIIEILSANKTEKSVAAASELYHMPKIINKLAGAVILAKFDLLKHDAFQLDGLIYNILANEQYSKDLDPTIEYSTYIKLALKSVVYAQANNMVPYIIDLLKTPSKLLGAQTAVCNALVQLKAIESIPILIESMKSEKFYALSAAFNALVSFGEEKAIPLAIARIPPEQKISTVPSAIPLIAALEQYTGKSFGKNKKAWEYWFYEKSNSVN